MPEKKCGHCSNWKEGRPEGIEELAVIDVLMSCGCGGDVKHSVLRCRVCGSHYLSSYYDHRAFHDDDYEVSSISEGEAKKLIRDIGKCSTPEDPGCRCGIHRKYEFIKIGKRIYSETIPD
jgi:hypothetical protein